MWTIFILALGVSFYLFLKPTASSLVKGATTQLNHSTSRWSGASYFDEQLAIGNLQYTTMNNEYTYEPQFDGHRGDGSTPFKIAIENGIWHIQSDSSMQPFKSGDDFSGCYVAYANSNQESFGTGDQLHASIQIKGRAYIRSFGFEFGKHFQLMSKLIDTHGKWQTLKYDDDDVISPDFKYRGLSLFIYYYPDTNLYARNLDASIN